LSRDSIIKQVAQIVGPGHAVDLKNYDLLIIVEAYQVCISFIACFAGLDEAL
jgi:tRNA acetyltransferase TAN1